MADERRVYRYCEKMIAATAAGIEAQGYPVPAAQFVSAGVPSFDDEILAASMLRIVPIEGDINTPRSSPLRPTSLHQRAAEIGVYLVTAVPTFESTGVDVFLPTPAELDSAADRLYGSTLAAVNGVLAEARTGAFSTATVVFVDSNTVGPEGGLVAQVFRWMVSLDANLGT